jgi:hypothetical protein
MLSTPPTSTPVASDSLLWNLETKHIGRARSCLPSRSRYDSNSGVKSCHAIPDRAARGSQSDRNMLPGPLKFMAKAITVVVTDAAILERQCNEIPQPYHRSRDSFASRDQSSYSIPIMTHHRKSQDGCGRMASRLPAADPRTISRLATRYLGHARFNTAGGHTPCE